MNPEHLKVSNHCFTLLMATGGTRPFHPRRCSCSLFLDADNHDRRAYGTLHDYCTFTDDSQTINTSQRAHTLRKPSRRLSSLVIFLPTDPRDRTDPSVVWAQGPCASYRRMVSARCPWRRCSEETERCPRWCRHEWWMKDRQTDRAVGDPLPTDASHKPRPPPVPYVMPPYWTLWSGSASPRRARSLSLSLSASRVRARAAASRGSQG